MTSSTSQSTRGSASGLQLGGGVDTGRSVNDACFDVDFPGASTAGLPGNLVGTARRPLHPDAIYPHDDQRRAHLQNRHAVQGSDAVEGLHDRPAAPRFHGERRVPEHLGANHHGELRGHPTPRSRRRWAATWRRAGPELCVRPPPGSADRPTDDVRRSTVATRPAFRETLRHSQRARLQANFNIYNVFNGSASSTLNTNYGPLWLQPSLLQDGRMVQFSGMLTF